jgi:hypothetical protein
VGFVQELSKVSFSNFVFEILKLYIDLFEYGGYELKSRDLELYVCVCFVECVGLRKWRRRNKEGVV